MFKRMVVFDMLSSHDNILLGSMAGSARRPLGGTSGFYAGSNSFGGLMSGWKKFSQMATKTLPFAASFDPIKGAAVIRRWSGSLHKGMSSAVPEKVMLKAGAEFAKDLHGKMQKNTKALLKVHHKEMLKGHVDVAKKYHETKMKNLKNYHKEMQRNVEDMVEDTTKTLNKNLEDATESWGASIGKMFKNNASTWLSAMGITGGVAALKGDAESKANSDIDTSREMLKAYNKVTGEGIKNLKWVYNMPADLAKKWNDKLGYGVFNPNDFNDAVVNAAEVGISKSNRAGTARFAEMQGRLNMLTSTQVDQNAVYYLYQKMNNKQIDTLAANTAVMKQFVGNKAVDLGTTVTGLKDALTMVSNSDAILSNILGAGRVKASMTQANISDDLYNKLIEGISTAVSNPLEGQKLAMAMGESNLSNVSRMFQQGNIEGIVNRLLVSPNLQNADWLRNNAQLAEDLEKNLGLSIQDLINLTSKRDAYFDSRKLLKGNISKNLGTAEKQVLINTVTSNQEAKINEFLTTNKAWKDFNWWLITVTSDFVNLDAIMGGPSGMATKLWAVLGTGGLLGVGLTKIKDLLLGKGETKKTEGLLSKLRGGSKAGSRVGQDLSNVHATDLLRDVQAGGGETLQNVVGKSSKFVTAMEKIPGLTTGLKVLGKGIAFLAPAIETFQGVTDFSRGDKVGGYEHVGSAAGMGLGALGGGAIVGGALGTALGPVGTLIGITLGTIIGDKLGGWIGKSFGEVNTKGIKDKLGKTWTSLEDSWSNSSFMKSWDDFWNYMPDTTAGKITYVAGYAIGMVQDLFTNVIFGLPKLMVQGMRSVWKWFSTDFPKVMGDLGSSLGNFLSNTIFGFFDKIHTAFDDLVSGKTFIKTGMKTYRLWNTLVAGITSGYKVQQGTVKGHEGGRGGGTGGSVSRARGVSPRGGSAAGLTMFGGKLTQEYGNPHPDGAVHHGIDFGMPVGTRILSTVSGVAYQGHEGSGYGNYAYVVDRGGNTHIFAHLNDVLVKDGQMVSRGDLLGRSGDTGKSTGPHLHYEVRNKAGVCRDPLAWVMGAGDASEVKASGSTYNAVSSVMSRYGIPPYVWFPIMVAESGGNPKAKPPYSTGEQSYGLFQINMTGKLGRDRLKNYSRIYGINSYDDLFDPKVNADIAANMMLSYYNTAKNKYITTGTLAERQSVTADVWKYGIRPAWTDAKNALIRDYVKQFVKTKSIKGINANSLGDYTDGESFDNGTYDPFSSYKFANSTFSDTYNRLFSKPLSLSGDMGRFSQASLYGVSSVGTANNPLTRFMQLYRGIKQARLQWQSAHQSGDIAGMNAAHASAEDARAQMRAMGIDPSLFSGSESSFNANLQTAINSLTTGGLTSSYSSSTGDLATKFYGLWETIKSAREQWTNAKVNSDLTAMNTAHAMAEDARAQMRSMGIDSSLFDGDEASFNANLQYILNTLSNNGLKSDYSDMVVSSKRINDLKAKVLAGTSTKEEKDEVVNTLVWMTKQLSGKLDNLKQNVDANSVLISDLRSRSRSSLDAARM